MYTLFIHNLTFYKRRRRRLWWTAITNVIFRATDPVLSIHIYHRPPLLHSYSN